MSSLTRERVFYFLTVVLSIVLVVICLLIGDQVGRYIRTEYEYVRTLRKLHHEDRFSHPIWASYGDYTNRVLYNSYPHFHDFERSIEKTSEKRILFLGDSYVEARQVSRSEIFYNLLTEMFRGEKQDVECMGMARSGWGALSSLREYRLRGEKYDPDIVVFVLFMGNDMENDYYPFSTKRNYLPSYALGADREVIGFHQKHPSVRINDVKGTLRKPYPMYSKFVPGIQFLLARAARNSFLVYEIAIFLRAIEEVPNRAVLAPNILGGLLRTPLPHVDEAISNTIEIVAVFSEDVTNQGRTFVVCLLPSKYQVEPEWFLSRLSNFPDSQNHEFDFDRTADSLAVGFSRRNINSINVLPAFRESLGREEIYWRNDGHLRPEGHVILARVLHSFFEEQNLLHLNP